MPDSGRFTLPGASFRLHGFRLDIAEEDSLWLIDEVRGLDLHVVTGARGDESFAAAVASWREGLVEEDGFRPVQAAEREVGGARAIVRTYLGREPRGGPARSWMTVAALVVTPDRTYALTLLVPPESRAAGQTAFAALLGSFAVGPP